MYRHVFDRNIDRFVAKWSLLLFFQFFAKDGLDIPKDFIEGTIHCKPGAASSLIERAYILLTHKTYDKDYTPVICCSIIGREIDVYMCNTRT